MKYEKIQRYPKNGILDSIIIKDYDVLLQRLLEMDIGCTCLLSCSTQIVCMCGQEVILYVIVYISCLASCRRTWWHANIKNTLRIYSPPREVKTSTLTAREVNINLLCNNLYSLCLFTCSFVTNTVCMHVFVSHDYRGQHHSPMMTHKYCKYCTFFSSSVR